jgi:hypothetical protein
MAIELNAVVIEPELVVGVNIPEIGTGLNIPGVPPNTGSLSTNVTTKDITTATTFPELISGITQTELLSTVAGVVNSEPTPGNFIVRLDQINTSLFEYKQIGKVAKDTLVTLEALIYKVTKILSHSVSNAEVISRTFIRPVLDNLLYSDSNYFYVDKAILDTNASQETKLFSISKTVNDTASINIALIFSSVAYKSLTDILTSTEYNSFSFTTIKQDSAIANELFNSLVNYIRNYSDLAINSDSKALNTGLNKQDVVSISSTDDITKLAGFNRIFEDTIAVTDDYLGNANIDDDQYAIIGKTITQEALLTIEQQYYFVGTVLADLGSNTDFVAKKASIAFLDTTIIGSTENLITTPTKNALDSIISLDANYANFGKVLQDQLISTDSSNYYTGKRLFDEIADVETNTFIVNKFTTNTLLNIEYNGYTSTTPKQDNIFTSDTFTRLVNYIRSYNDRSITSDTSNTTIGLNKQDVVNISSVDNITKLVNFLRTFQDTLTVTDDYLGNANIDDDQYAIVGKKLPQEILRVIDAIETIIEYIRRLADTGRATDTKTLSARPGKSEILVGTDVLFAILTSIKDLIYGATDTIASAETLTRLVNYNKIYNDIGIGTEIFSRLVNYTRSYSDTGTGNEIFSRLVNYIRPYSDTSTSVESRNFSSQLLKSETSTSTEVFAFLPRIGKSETSATTDASVFLSNLLKAETGTGTEARLVSLNLLKSNTLLSTDTLTYVISDLTQGIATPIDTIRSTDSGIINTQNYFASSYVVSGYAGTNVAFGG